MKTHYIFDEKLNIIQVYCDTVEKLYFKDMDEFNIFVKFHPSCTYKVLKEEYNGTISAYFCRYLQNYWNGFTTTQKLSYNQNPSDDNELREYYKLLSKEEELKTELNRIQELRKKYEV